MPRVCIGVHPAPIWWRTIHRLFNWIRHANATQGYVAAGNTLGKLHNVGLVAPVLQPEPGTGAPKPSDHLVADKEHVIFVTDGTNTREVVVLRHNNAPGP